MRPARLSTHCSVVFVRHIIDVSRARTQGQKSRLSDSESRSCLLLVSKLSLRVYEMLIAEFLRYLDLTGFHCRGSLDYMFVDRLKRLNISVKYQSRTLEFLLRRLPILASLEELEICVSGRAETELVRKSAGTASLAYFRLHLSSLRNVRKLTLVGGAKTLWDHIVVGVAEGSRDKLTEVKIPSIGLPDTLEALSNCPNLRTVNCEEYEADDAGYDYVDVRVSSEVFGDLGETEPVVRVGLQSISDGMATNGQQLTQSSNSQEVEEFSLKVNRRSREDCGEFLSQFKRLKKLYLNFYEADNIGVPSALPKLKTLSYLTRLTLEDARDCNFFLVFSCCPKLMTISLISCSVNDTAPLLLEEPAMRFAADNLFEFALYDCTCRRAVLLSLLKLLRGLETLILVDVCDESTLDLSGLIDEVIKSNSLGFLDRLKLGDFADDAKLPLALGSNLENLSLLEWEGNWTWNECQRAEIESTYALTLPAIRLYSNRSGVD